MDEGRHVLVRLLPGALLQDPGGHQVRCRKLPGASVMKKNFFPTSLMPKKSVQCMHVHALEKRAYIAIKRPILKLKTAETTFWFFLASFHAFMFTPCYFHAQAKA